MHWWMIPLSHIALKSSIHSAGLGVCRLRSFFCDPAFNFSNALLMLYQNYLWFTPLDLLHFLSHVWRQYSLSKRAIALALASCGSQGVTIAISFNDGAIWEAADWQMPPEKGLTEVTAGLSTLPGCPRLWPCVIPCASQTLPQHTVTCLVTSCVVANPFPITQAYVLLYPVCQLNLFTLVHACFLLF